MKTTSLDCIRRQSLSKSLKQLKVTQRSLDKSHSKEGKLMDNGKSYQQGQPVSQVAMNRSPQKKSNKVITLASSKNCRETLKQNKPVVKSRHQSKDDIKSNQDEKYNVDIGTYFLGYIPVKNQNIGL